MSFAHAFNVVVLNYARSRYLIESDDVLECLDVPQ